MSASYRVRIDAPDMLTDLKRLLFRRDVFDRLVPALRDVSFTVAKGTRARGHRAQRRRQVDVVPGAQRRPPSRAGRVTVRGRLNLLSPGIGFSADAHRPREHHARRAGERSVARAPGRDRRRDRRVRAARRVPRPADALVLGRHAHAPRFVDRRASSTPRSCSSTRRSPAATPRSAEHIARRPRSSPARAARS